MRLAMMPGTSMLDEYQRAEIAYRISAFHTLYDHTLREEEDLFVRFAKAIVYSSRPIKPDKRATILKWYRTPTPYHRQRKGKA